MKTTGYAVQFRNPSRMKYSAGVEFPDRAEAIAAAEHNSGEVCVRVVEITRKVIWRRGPSKKASP